MSVILFYYKNYSLNINDGHFLHILSTKPRMLHIQTVTYQ